MSDETKTCDDCDEDFPKAKMVPVTDPWGGVHGWKCKPCDDNYEPPEPDMNAVSWQERQELDARSCREAGR